MSKIKICPCCQQEFTKTQNIYCSRSCAAKVNNSKKDFSVIKTGPAKKILTKEELEEKRIKKNLRKRSYPKKIIESTCQFCSRHFQFLGKSGTKPRKRCDNRECILEGIKHNRVRGKQSYMERTFSEWLIKHKILFRTEVHFRNTEINRSYFIDFLFEDLKVIIELDGLHHELPERKASDIVRDDFLTRQGYKVIRITEKEYRSQSRTDEVKHVLKIDNCGIEQR